MKLRETARSSPRLRLAKATGVEVASAAALPLANSPTLPTPRDDRARVSSSRRYLAPGMRAENRRSPRRSSGLRRDVFEMLTATSSSAANVFEALAACARESRGPPCASAGAAPVLDRCLQKGPKPGFMHRGREVRSRRGRGALDPRARRRSHRALRVAGASRMGAAAILPSSPRRHLQGSRNRRPRHAGSSSSGSRHGGEENWPSLSLTASRSHPVPRAHL